MNEKSHLAIAALNSTLDIDNKSLRIKKLNELMNDIVLVIQKLDLPLARIVASESEDSSLLLSFVPVTLAGKEFKLSYEEAREYYSEGTFNTINMVITLKVMLLINATILIDEFDGNLHHKLSHAVLEFIRASRGDESQTQVIMSTHDILLLDSGFRRDGIFMLQKDQEQSAVITRADEFSVRKDAKLSVKYLNNEFGALPNILSDSKHG